MKSCLAILFACLCAAAHAEDALPPQAATIPACTAQAGTPGVPHKKRKKAGAGPTLYVAEPSASLRKDPAPDAQVLGEVPIGTALQASCTQDGWLHVWATEFHGLIGWIRSEDVQDSAPTAGGLRAAYLKAGESGANGDGHARQRIAARWAALAPLDIEAQTALVAALEGDADKDALARARTELALLKEGKVERKPGEPQAIFLFNGGIISPLAALQGKELLAFRAGSAADDADAASERFAAQYFLPRRVYHLYADGTAAGLLRVSGRSNESCYSIQANVGLENNALAQREGAGVATNFPLADSGVHARPVGPADLQALLPIAQAILRKHHVSEAHIADMLRGPAKEGSGFTVNTLHDQARDTDLLVAVFRGEFVPPPSAPNAKFKGDALTLVLERTAPDAGKIAYQSFVETDEQDGFGADIYLTHADLNHDGSEELVFQGFGYESWHYFVLGRKDGKWVRLVEGESYGC